MNVPAKRSNGRSIIGGIVAETSPRDYRNKLNETKKKEKRKKAASVIGTADATVSIRVRFSNDSVGRSADESAAKEKQKIRDEPRDIGMRYR